MAGGNESLDTPAARSGILSDQLNGHTVGLVPGGTEGRVQRAGVKENCAA